MKIPTRTKPQTGERKFPSAEEFCTSIGLYASYTFICEGEVTNELVKLLYFDGTFDSFCIKCKQQSTFKILKKEIPPEYDSGIFGRMTRQDGPIDIADGIYKLIGACARDDSHKNYYLFYVGSFTEAAENGSTVIKKTIQKIGQYPAYGDTSAYIIKKYSKLLSEGQLSEFNRAIKLASHDVGIGAFVYLRRIFESLVEEAHTSAKNTLQGWDEERYQKVRTAEKIRMLSVMLPDFLVTNTGMYSLLSKGIHEFSEEECLRYFHVLRVGIEIVLDDKLQRIEQKRKIEEAERALGKAISELK